MSFEIAIARQTDARTEKNAQWAFLKSEKRFYSVIVFIIV